MSARPRLLPDFSRPPVTEVVLSLQFGTLTALKTAHVGFLWSKIRRRYPNVSEQAPIDPVFETFSAPLTSHQIRFEALIAPPFPRYWFETADGSHLFQLQQDRVVHNWRQRNDKPYPRYEKVRAELLKDLDAFEALLAKESLGTLVFNQVEVAYVNTISLPGDLNPHAALDTILEMWRGNSIKELELEDMAFRARYLIRTDGAPTARLHVTFSPMITSTATGKSVRFDLTFRGKPGGEDRAAALTLMDDGRATIVKAFAKLTKPEMHTRWGIRDA